MGWGRGGVGRQGILGRRAAGRAVCTPRLHSTERQRDIERAGMMMWGENGNEHRIEGRRRERARRDPGKEGAGPHSKSSESGRKLKGGSGSEKLDVAHWGAPITSRGVRDTQRPKVWKVE